MSKTIRRANKGEGHKPKIIDPKDKRNVVKSEFAMLIKRK